MERYGNNATYSQRSGTENATCELFLSLVEKCGEIWEQGHVQSEIRYRESHVAKMLFMTCFFTVLLFR